MRVWIAAAIASAASTAVANPTFNVPGDAVPDQTFYLANPGTVLNVNNGGVVGPFGDFNGNGSVDDTNFDLNTGIINVNNGGTLLGFPAEALFERGTLNLAPGGSVGDFARFFNSEINMAGGVVGSSLLASLDTTANVSGGTIGSLTVVADSTLNMTGGTIGQLSLRAASAKISGGSLGQAPFGAPVFVGDFSNFFPPNTNTAATLEISGGTIFDRLFIGNDGTVNLIVTEATLNGVPLDLELDETRVITQRQSSLLELVLADGSPASLTLNNGGGTGSMFNSGSVLTVTRVIPSPAGALPLSLCMWLACARRR